MDKPTPHLDKLAATLRLELNNAEMRLKMQVDETSDAAIELKIVAEKCRLFLKELGREINHRGDNKE